MWGSIQHEFFPAQNASVEKAADFSRKNRTLSYPGHGNQVGTSLSPCLSVQSTWWTNLVGRVAGFWVKLNCSSKAGWLNTTPVEIYYQTLDHPSSLVFVFLSTLTVRASPFCCCHNLSWVTLGSQGLATSSSPLQRKKSLQPPFTLTPKPTPGSILTKKFDLFCFWSTAGLLVGTWLTTYCKFLALHTGEWVICHFYLALKCVLY